MRRKLHICSDCPAISVPVRKEYPNGLTGPVCSGCGSEDIFPYQTKRDKEDHEAALKLRQDIKMSSVGKRMGPEFDGGDDAEINPPLDVISRRWPPRPPTRSPTRSTSSTSPATSRRPRSRSTSRRTTS